MKIALDVDGVIADFIARAKVKFGECDDSLWRLDQRWPDRKDEIDVFVRDPKTYYGLDPIQHAIWGLWHLRRHSFDLAFMTARPVDIAVTEKWLDWWTYPYRFTETWGIDYAVKPEWYQKIGADMVVEDDPVCVEKCRQLGIQAIVFDQPWNRNVIHPRAVGWIDLVEIITGEKVNP